jgi:DNA-binding SARP family transcriptional activator/TolB-like protein/Flp pilus assembly protein TadD
MLLGPFVAKDRKGAEVIVPKKARALLAFLVVERGRQLARDDLAALLWSNTGSEQARQSLRQCLSVLRRTLPEVGDALVTDGSGLELHNTEALKSDLDDWLRLQNSNSPVDLANADALHRGEFVAGLNLPKEPFEDWAGNERHRLLTARQSLLVKLAELQGQGGNLAGALETAQRLTVLDPYREESSRLLMELFAASGQRGLALVEHARVERMLRERLQLSPDPATRRLAEQIRRGERMQWRWAQSPASRAPDNKAMTTVPTVRQYYTPVDRAAVTLLPFSNLMGDPAGDDFAQAITEDVASALVRERWPINVALPPHAPLERANAANAVGTQYVASGSVRRDSNRVRVVVLLADAVQNRQLWSGRVDAEGDTPFALQDRLCQQVVSKLATAVRSAEFSRAGRLIQPIEELSPYQMYLRAEAVCRRGQAGNAAALKLLRRATDLAPELGIAHALSARCLHLQRLMGWAHPEEPALNEAVKHAHRAVEVDANDPQALWMAGLALANIGGNLTDGRYLVDRSLSINPSDASAWIASCFVDAHSSKFDAAIAHFKRAQEINAEDGSQHVQWHAAATAYFIAGQHDEADAATDRALAEKPGYPGSLRLKVATSALLGRTDAAEQAARNLLIVNPAASIAHVRSYWRLWAPHTEHAMASMLEGWRRVGMPEG